MPVVAVAVAEAHAANTPYIRRQREKPMHLFNSLTLATIIALAATISACGGSDEASAKPSSAMVKPSDPALASLYNSSCISCHAKGYGSAPRSGDAAAWAPRMEKGMDTLLDNAINGFKGMPPLGACTDCTEDDFVALIEFMASPPQ
jgi:cytochrome c5